MLQGQKLQELEKVVGRSMREEEPDGKDVAEEKGSGNHPHNKLASLPQLVLTPISSSSLFSYLSEFSHILVLILLTDESDEEMVVKPKTKEEEEVRIVHSWMEVGGFPVLPEEEAWGLLQGVGSLFLPDTYMTVFPHCSPFIPYFTSPFLCFLF